MRAVAIASLSATSEGGPGPALLQGQPLAGGAPGCYHPTTAPTADVGFRENRQKPARSGGKDESMGEFRDPLARAAAKREPATALEALMEIRRQLTPFPTAGAPRLFVALDCSDPDVVHWRAYDRAARTVAQGFEILQSTRASRGTPRARKRGRS